MTPPPAAVEGPSPGQSEAPRTGEAPGIATQFDAPVSGAGARSRIFSVFPVAAAVFALDLATKWLANTKLDPGRSLPLVGDTIRFTLVHNSGGAFGLFPGRGFAFIAFSIAAIGLILFMAFRLPARSTRESVALGALLGGALGNLQDRMRTGLVIDFIDIGMGNLRWPVFNVADIAVTLGVIALLIGALRRPG